MTLDVLSGVGVGDFGEMGRVEVDLSLSDTEDLRSDTEASVIVVPMAESLRCRRRAEWCGS